MTGAYFLYWLLWVNAVSFLQMIADKRRAEVGDWRYSEGRLLGWMALGGAPGGWMASRLVRHKTRKQPFATQMRMLGIFWVGTAGLWLSGLLDPLTAQALAIIERTF